MTGSRFHELWEKKVKYGLNGDAAFMALGVKVGRKTAFKDRGNALADR